MADGFSGRLGIQQRVIPTYRAPFFDALASECLGGLSVFAGSPQPDEGIPAADRLQMGELVQAKNYYFLKVSSPFFQCWQAGLLEWLERWQPQALIIEANPRYRSTPAAVRWMHRRGRPVLGWGLGAPPLAGSLAAWRQRARRQFLLELDGIIAYSQTGAEEYRRLGFPSGRVFIAPNAAAHRPAGLPPSRPAAPPDRTTLLFVGRLQARKRIDLLLAACAALPEPLQPKVKVVGDGPARSDFEAAARRFYPSTEFCGALYGADLKVAFAQADLFVLPGTGGLAVQQAMSHGLPVIVAESDGTQGDLVRPENGWLVPPNNQETLAAVLQEALSNLQRLRQMGEESYRIVTEEINIEVMVARFREALSRTSRS